MTASSRGLIRATVGVVVALSAAACGNSPNGPSAGPVASAAPSAVSQPQSQAADLAACLGGSGAASCFNAAGVVHAAAATLHPAAVNSAPTSLSQSVNGTTVNLSWTVPGSGDPVISYTIEAGSAPGLVNLANFNTGNALTNLSVPAVPNGTYFVRVRAVNASGTGAPSNEVVVIVGATGACAGPPRSLSVASQSAGTISLAWLAPTAGSPTSYVIQAGSAPGLADLANFDTGSPSLAYVAGGVPPGSYYVRIYSRSSCGLSSTSNEVLAFVVGFSGDVQVSVSWDAPSDVDLHVVEPSGEEIFYGHRTSATGGQLDVDSNPACSIDGRQIENIRWNTRAPAGTYTVRVDYWTSCGVPQTNYLVTVKNGASTQTFAGNFTGVGDTGASGSGRLITTFAHAASALSAARAMEIFRAPELFVPSEQKLRASGIAR